MHAAHRMLLVDLASCVVANHPYNVEGGAMHFEAFALDNTSEQSPL